MAARPFLKNVSVHVEHFVLFEQPPPPPVCTKRFSLTIKWAAAATFEANKTQLLQNPLKHSPQKVAQSHKSFYIIIE